jgi:acetoin utilization deacetylase AcuC-like enzyme
VRVVYSPRHVQHDPRFEVLLGSVQPMLDTVARAESIRGALEAAGGFPIVEPSEHGREPIEAVHDPGLVRFIETAWSHRQPGVDELIPDTFPHPAMREGMAPYREPEGAEGKLGYWTFETCTPIVAGTYDAARSAVDVALTAADLVLDGDAAVYGLCRPPGHHAPRRAFGGYCYFNNAAIATEYLARKTGEPISILDVDFHHGNGTQQIFYDRAEVLFVSLHADPHRAYPYYTGYADETGTGSGLGTTLNLPLAAGITDDQYLEALEPALERITQFGGSIVVVSLGFDTYGQDPIGDFALTTAVYHEVGKRVAALGRRLVILQEGGYYRSALGENARAWLRGAEGCEHDPRPAAGFDTGSAAG